MTGRRRGAPALLLAALMVAGACGTRLPDEAFVAAGAGPAGGAAAGPQSGTGGAGPVAAGSTAPGTTAAGSGAPGAGPATGGPAGGPGTTVAGGPAPPDVATGPNQASDVGITETTVRIGTIVAENGVLGDAFAPAVRGLRAWVEYINAQGGIGGRTVELFTCDDREDRARALECARQLVEGDQVFALIATNTRAFGGAAPYLDEQGVPVIGIPITNSFYRYPHMWSVYGDWYPKDGTTVANNGELMLQTGPFRWFRENLGLTRAAVFAYDIAESAQAADFFVEGLELEGFEVTRYDVSFAAPSFDQPVADMQRRGTEIIFDGMDDGANRRLCDAMGRRGFSVAAKVSTVVAFGASMGADFPEGCRNSIFITGLSRPYTDTSVPLIADFNQAMATYQPGVELHQWALEAWVMGTMLRDFLVQAGPAPTRAGVDEFMAALHGYTAEGVMVGLSFQPRDYGSPTLEDCITISRWQDSAPGGWVRATEPFPLCYPDAHNYGSPVREQGD